MSQKEVPFGNLTTDKDIEVAKRVYTMTIKAKALDLLRGLLPSSTMTNMGITGNGRAFEALAYPNVWIEAKRDQVYCGAIV